MRTAAPVSRMQRSTGRGAPRDALLIRDRIKLRMWNGPGSAAQHFAMARADARQRAYGFVLRRARDTGE